jgi:hypothetical protein
MEGAGPTEVTAMMFDRGDTFLLEPASFRGLLTGQRSTRTWLVL